MALLNRKDFGRTDFIMGAMALRDIVSDVAKRGRAPEIKALNVEVEAFQATNPTDAEFRVAADILWRAIYDAARAAATNLALMRTHKS